MGTVVYDTGDKGQKTSPKVCDSTSLTSGYRICANNCSSSSWSFISTSGLLSPTLPCTNNGLFASPTSISTANLLSGLRSAVSASTMADCLANCAKNYCQPCTLLRTLTGTDEVYYGWVNAETTSTENQTVIACASSALNDSYIGRRTRRRRGTGIVDIDHLEQWLSQVEPAAKQKDSTGKNWVDVSEFLKYCGVKDEPELRKAKLSKSLSSKEPLCVNNLGDTGTRNKAPDDECSYINPNYALCDTHLYNASISANTDLKDTATRARVKEIVALKVNVITEQMYKQYEFLAATLRRLKTHLEKSVLTANLQAAGATSSNGSSSDSGSGRGGARSNDDDQHVKLNGATNCSGIMDFDQFFQCLQNNVSLITTHASSNGREACVQLQYTLDEAHSRFTMAGFSGFNATSGGNWVYCKPYMLMKTDTTGKEIGIDRVNVGKNCNGSKKKQDIINCANEIIGRASTVKREMNGSSGGRVVVIPGT